MKKLRGVLILTFIIGLCFTIQAQRDSNKVVDITDSTELMNSGKTVSAVLPEYVPRKALLYSAILPGLGQAYNGKYWKVPIVYGGFIGLGYMVSFYNEQYNIFKKELFLSLENPSFVPPSGASRNQLENLVLRARRERDYMIVFTGLFYLIQIADAHIDAHLREFELNPELNVKIGPNLDQIGPSPVYGLGITLKF